MNPLKEIQSHIPEIEKKLGYQFQDKQLLVLALTHRSFVNEHRHLVEEHNERLEFLGDAILGLLISGHLYQYLPSTPEGELSYLRSCLVDAAACYSYTLSLDVDQFVLLGKGEQRNGGRGRESILADLFESILGAIYIDGGIEAAKKYLFGKFSTMIEEILKQPDQNWKAIVQDYAQKKYRQTPEYQMISAEGPDHQKQFSVAVFIGGKEMGRGQGTSKKEAQQAAAQAAMQIIEGKDVQG